MWLVGSTAKLRLPDIPLLRFHTHNITRMISTSPRAKHPGQSVGGPGRPHMPAWSTLSPSERFCSPEHPLSPGSASVDGTVRRPHLCHSSRSPWMKRAAPHTALGGAGRRPGPIKRPQQRAHILCLFSFALMFRDKAVSLAKGL